MPYQDERKKEIPFPLSRGPGQRPVITLNQPQARTFGDKAAVTAGTIPFTTNLPKLPNTVNGAAPQLRVNPQPVSQAQVPGGLALAGAATQAIGQGVESMLGLAPEAQRLAQFQQRTAASQPASPPAVAPAPTAPRPRPAPGALPNDPGAQAIAKAPSGPQRSFDATNVPTEFQRSGLVSAPGGSAEISKQAAFADKRRSERQAQAASNNAETDANITNARNTSLRNQLQSELNRTKPTSESDRRRGYRRRPGDDARAQLIAQITGLNQQVAPAQTDSLTDVQKANAEISAAGDKAKGDAVQLEAGKLALQAEQRKAALQQQITQLAADDPALPTLRANLAVLSGKNPYEGRFEAIEELGPEDAFGTRPKLRSLYDTQTGTFVARGGAAAASPPSKEVATAEAKAAVKAGKDKALVNERLKQLGYPTI